MEEKRRGKICLVAKSFLGDGIWYHLSVGKLAAMSLLSVALVIYGATNICLVAKSYLGDCIWYHLSVGKLAAMSLLSVVLVIYGAINMYRYHHFNEVLSGNVDNEVGLFQILHEKHKIQPPEKDHRLPKCILIGVQKGGTRAVLDFLGSLHPDIVVLSTEANFFNDNSKYTKGLEFYIKLMPLSFANQITLEKSPSYFKDEKVARRVQHSSVKLLLTVRNPVSRIVSAYTMFWRKKREKQSFKAAVFDDDGNVNRKSPYVHKSTYHTHLTRWLRYFPRKQIHIIDGEKFVKDPYDGLFKIESFLGIGHKISEKSIQFNTKKGFYCMVIMNATKCLGRTKGQPHVHVPKSQLEKLRKYFEPLNERFFKVAGIRFDWK